MFKKDRKETDELKILRSLNTRMDLPTKEKQYSSILEKGFEGEKNWDVWLKTFSNEWLILNDLLFEQNNSHFQIDSLLISNHTIYLIDVKNYEGDFYIDDDKWFSTTGKEIKNQLLQLRRCESLLRSLLKELGLTFSIEAYLIFINPECTFYKVPLDLPLIFSTQINRFAKNLKTRSAKLTDKHHKAAELLVSRHIEESPFKHLPDYDYSQLQKGITCSSCNSFIRPLNEKKLICDVCGCVEDIESAVLRSVEDYQLLFPDQKITTNGIYEWCDVIESKKTIRRFLKKNFTLIGHSSTSFYVNTGVDD